MTQLGKGKRRKAVIMLIMSDDLKVLFIKRSLTRKNLPGMWSLPAGHIEKGENFKITAIREAREELGINVEDVQFIKKINNPHREQVEAFLVSISSNSYTGVPLTKGDEFDKIAWMRTRDFYSKFKDQEITPALRYLRKYLLLLDSTYRS